MRARTRSALVVAPTLLALSVGSAVATSPEGIGSAGGAAPVQSRGGYKFLSRHHGYRYVARWNPCAKVRYEINARHAPKHGVRDAKKAIRRISRVSGIRFEYRGRTGVVPRPRASRGYRGRTDLVIAWTTPRKRKVLRGRSGYGGMWWRVVRENGKRHGKAYKGYVLLNRNVEYPAGFGYGHTGGYGTEGQLLMHELGHAVGLWHVRQRDEVMYPYTLPRKARWGNGDRRGLHRVGRPAGCLPRRGSPTAEPALSMDSGGVDLRTRAAY